MRRRGSPDIISTILEAANGGMGKRKLLTKGNLTSTHLKKYIDLLPEKELLAEYKDRSSGHSAYKTTGLRLQYLVLYNSIRSVG